MIHIQVKMKARENVGPNLDSGSKLQPLTLGPIPMGKIKIKLKSVQANSDSGLSLDLDQTEL